MSATLNDLEEYKKLLPKEVQQRFSKEQILALKEKQEAFADILFAVWLESLKKNQC